MKKLPFFFILLFTLPLLMMCEKEKNSSSIIISDQNISKSDLVLELKGNEVQLNSEIKELFLDNINQKFSINADNIHRIAVEHTNNPSFVHKNLIFDISSSSSVEQMPPVAIVLQQNALKNGTAISFFAKESHSCTGAPCHCCAFMYDSSGDIMGCKCNGNNHRGSTCSYQLQQKCNHTVTSN